MKFNTKYAYTKTPPEKNSGVILTKSDGYVPIERQVRHFLNAGDALTAMRELQYQYPSEYDGDDFEPVMISRYADKTDLADFVRDQTRRNSEMRQSIINRRNEMAKEIELRQEQERLAQQSLDVKSAESQ